MCDDRAMAGRKLASVFRRGYIYKASAEGGLAAALSVIRKRVMSFASAARLTPQTVSDIPSAAAAAAPEGCWVSLPASSRWGWRQGSDGP